MNQPILDHSPAPAPSGLLNRSSTTDLRRPRRSVTSPRVRTAFRRVSALVAASALGMAVLPQPTQAATTFAVTALSAQVQGSSVLASVTMTASTSTRAQKLNVCVRSATGANVDYPGLLDTVVDAQGKTYSATKLLGLGTYTYWGCIKVADRWYDVGTRKTFTVAPTTSVDTIVPMPTTTTKAGWAYSYGQDFTTPAPLGQFSAVYGSKWAGYRGTRNDTSRNGSYQPDKVLSVANGKLNMALGYDSTTGLYNVAAPFPQPPAGVNGGSQEYLGMRTTVRFRSSNPIPGYKVAWLLWPSSWNWNDGEIDFPEANLDSAEMWGFSHQAGTGSPQLNALWAKAPAAFYDGWHTATTEWVPGKSVEFFLDGVSIGRTTQYVPTKPMHWTLQTETALTSTPPPTTSKGNISIDWLTVESYKP